MQRVEVFSVALCSECELVCNSPVIYIASSNYSE